MLESGFGIRVSLRETSFKSAFYSIKTGSAQDTFASLLHDSPTKANKRSFGVSGDSISKSMLQAVSAAEARARIEKNFMISKV